MARSLILAVRIIGDAKDAVRAMDQISGKSDVVGSALKTAARVGTVALAGIMAAAKECGDAASELEQSTGAVASVFGEYSDKMNGFAKSAADAVGLSQSQYGNMASVLGAQLKNMGISLEESSTKTNDLIGLGSDLAATFGGSTSDAVSALSALLRGERDPIERYGVSIKQADIEAEKAALGLTGLSGEAAKNADLQATLSLLTKQTADAHGQFAREADSAAGSSQIAAAHFENAKAALGEKLLPIMTEASKKLAELASWFQSNAEWITPLVGVIAGLAAGVIVINGAYQAFAAVQALQTAAQWANNAAWLASPITWIVLAVIAAIALLVVAIVAVVKNWDKIKAAAIAVWNAIIAKIQTVIDWVKVRIVAAIVVLIQGWTRIKTAAVAVWNAIIAKIQTVIGWLRVRIISAIARAISWFTNLKTGAVNVFKSIIKWVKDAVSWIGQLASNVIPGWAKDLLGMSQSRAMPIVPELQPLAEQSFSARMAVAPAVENLEPVAAAATPPPILAGQVAVFSILSAMLTGNSKPEAKTTNVYEGDTTITVNIPNYVGDKRELVDWLEKALKEAARKKDAMVRI